MKRLLWIPLIFLYSTLWAADIQLARMNPYIAGAGVVAACSETTPDSATTQNSDNDYAYNASYYSASQSWTTSSAYTIKHIQLNLKKVGTGFQSTVYICTDNSGDPSTTCQQLDDVIPAASLTTDYAWYCVNIAAGYAVTTSTRYHIVVVPDGAAGAANYNKWGYAGAGTEQNNVGASDAITTGTWNNVDTSSTGNFKVGVCSCP